MNMKSLSKRPGRLMDEVEYTQKHLGETFNKSLRNNPIEFVKAKEVYKREDKKEVEKEDNESATEDLKLTTDNNKDHINDQINESENDAKIETNSLENEEVPNVRDFSINDNAITLSNDVPIKQDNIKISPENQVLLDLLNVPKSSNHHPSVTFSSDEDLSDEPHVVLEQLSINREVSDGAESSEGESDAFVIDTAADSNISLPKPDMSSIIDSKPIKGDIPALEHDTVLNIGKVSMNTVTDTRGNTVTELEENKKTRGFAERTVVEKESDFAGYRDYIKQVMKRMNESDEDEDDEDLDSDEMEWDEIDQNANAGWNGSDSASESESEDLDPEIEYGFLPEDYEFDVSQISITNVRFGIQNQFYTRNLELTGSVDEYTWVDEDELIDFVMLKGVKEHRLNSFLKFVTGGLLEMSQPEEPDYDVHISDSSSEEEEEEIDYGDDIEALIALSKQQQQNFISADDMFPTKSIQTKGKGRRKHLDIDGVDLDIDIRQSLQDQFQIRRTSKKQKKLDHANAKLEDGLRKHDLLVKYPYSILVQDIRKEFELLLHDSRRDTLSFPPLDPHGNKTLCKFAKCYNMKAMKCGNNGLKLFIKVAKNKKTFHYLPNYNEVTYMLKQRPIFNRTDQKRPKDEIVETDGNLKKDRARGRNKPKSNAEIREGEVVGAQAPEIRHDNFGRLMLERLGWVKGEGLGALGNKGISEPVMATVKKSKTGLRTSTQDEMPDRE